MTIHWQMKIQMSQFAISLLKQIKSTNKNKNLTRFDSINESSSDKLNNGKIRKIIFLILQLFNFYDDDSLIESKRVRFLLLLVYFICFNKDMAN